MVKKRQTRHANYPWLPIRHMDEEKFNRLLEKYQQGKLSPAARRLLEQWLDSLAMKTPPVTWSAEEKENLKTAVFRAIRREQPAARTTLPPVASYGLRLAASVLLVLAFAAGLFLLVRQGAETSRHVFTNTTPVIHKVILSDGSLVWLQPGSEIAFAQTPDTRHVALKGDALFEVAKDPLHPFEVTCNGVKARVLGTSFYVADSAHHTSISVLTGRVAVTFNDRETIVVPDQELVCSPERALPVTRTITAEREADLVTGTGYRMIFDDALAMDVLQRIGEKFGVQIQYTDGDLGHCHLTADFTDQSLAVTLEAMSGILGFSYAIQGKKVTLSGGGC